MLHDLILSGGILIDPAQALHGRMDIAVKDGRISAISEQIPTEQATRVIKVDGDQRYVTPGLIDLHTHVAYGATTAGVGMQCCDPDDVGVRAGVTTVVDAGSVGVANIGVFGIHILPHAKTRVIPFLNVGTHAHTTPRWHDVDSVDEIDRDAIEACIEANPGLIQGLKVRLVGPVAQSQGDDLINLAKTIARGHNLPLMVHIGDRTAEFAAHSEVTRHVMTLLERGDILTHIATSQPGGAMAEPTRTAPIAELTEARTRGVVLDAAQGRMNFSFDVARQQAELGLHPDTISSDITLQGQLNGVFSLMECMGRYLAVGYTVEEVVRMTTSNAATALGMAGEIGTLAIGRQADVSVIEVVDGNWSFTDSSGLRFSGHHAVAPVLTLLAGEVFSPSWGPHPWGWLPAEPS